MNNKLLNRIAAGIVFLVSFVQFLLTAQPSVSFWDCGEFTAAAVSLQVPHPPGAPFFGIIGRFFSMMPFLGENIGFRVNMVSVLSSALSVMLLYLIAVKLIENFRGSKDEPGTLDRIVTYFGAAIGALSLSFSDTFWFNAVEAEVYAASTLLFAIITYLIVRWNEKADERGNEKYLLLIALLVGISMGVHLMSVLAIVPVVMVIVFRKYIQDEEACKKTGYLFLVHSALLFVVALALWSGQTAQTPLTPEEFHEFDVKFVWTMVGISVVFVGIFWKKIISRNSFYTGLLFGGIALVVCYPGVVKKLPGLLLSVAGSSNYTALFVLLVVLGLLTAAVAWSVKNKRPTLHLVTLSLIFVIVGFVTYAMVIIRANKQPPMNENEPKGFSELVSYLNREQYGDFPIFKRRFASEPHQEIVYTNYSSDLDFFVRYQMDHMFQRYLFWNYIGREGWDQDMGVNWRQLFGIPFLIGLFGIFFHFRKDWKMASVFMVMFIFQGYLTAFYQNQQEPQPRERDYFYVGAFFVYSVWIALGIKGIAELIKESIKSSSMAKGLTYAALALGVIFIPARMAQANWHTHDRSNNWVPWDYSYNLLQSCAPNAILFTNGDNDTFPLWYLQDVEGVRRDVRIANLSLLNTNWYIKQLKNTEPYGAERVAISYADETIDNLRPREWRPQMVSLPVPPEAFRTTPGTSSEMPALTEVMEKYGMADSSIMREGKLTFRMNGQPYGDFSVIRVQDLMVRDIIEQNNWKRPIYFAVTCSEDSKIGLQDYLIMEGLAQRLVPFKRRPNTEFVNEDLMKANLYSKQVSSSKEYKPGFNFRGLSDPDVFFDDNHERLTQNYRSAFMRLAIHYLYVKNDKQLCLQTLDKMGEIIPREKVKIPYGLLYDISNIYYTAGGMKQYEKLAREIEQTALKQMAENPSDVNSYYSPYRILTDIYSNLRDYDNAVKIWSRLADMFPNDPSVKRELDRYKALAAGTQTDTTK